MLKWIKQKFCKHNFKPVQGTEKLIGITLEWNLKPSNEYEQVYKCTKCGVEKNYRYTYFMGYVHKD